MSTETKTNAFKPMEVTKNSKFVTEVLKDVTGINLSEQEVQKLKIFLRYEIKGNLFDSINAIYGVIGANFTEPSRFLIIPFVHKGSEHLNIQKI